MKERIECILKAALDSNSLDYRQQCEAAWPRDALNLLCLMSGYSSATSIQSNEKEQKLSKVKVAACLHHHSNVGKTKHV